MEAEGVVVRRQGRGTFVNDRASDDFAARFSNLRDADGKEIFGQIQSTEVAEGAATALEQERLRLSQDEIVYRIHRTRAHTGRIFMVEDTSLPAALFPGLAKAQSGPDELTVLAREHRILLGTSEERVFAVMPSAPIASALGVAPGAAVMLLDRVVRMLDGDRPVEWRVAFCHLPAGHYLTKMR
jgi:GntR family transcriptional regulator